MGKPKKKKKKYVFKNKVKIADILKGHISVLKEKMTFNRKEAPVKTYGKEWNKALKSRKKLLEDTLKELNSSYKEHKISNKIMERFKEWFGTVTYKETGAWRQTEETAFKQMILNKLADSGVNIFDPTELNKALHGMTVDEVVEAWAEADELDEGGVVVRTSYEQFNADPVGFMDKLGKISKKAKSIKKKQDEALIALGINPA